MATYITIDGGTTNTRIGLVKDNNLIEIVKLDVGAGKGKEVLKTAVKKGIDKIMSRIEETPECILASGMITSEYGLVNLPHITTPVGIKELHNSMEKVVIDDVCSIPFYFARGVKTQCSDIENADMMRGEETELMGILNPLYGKCIYVLPGSHSKIIRVDEKGRIVDFATMLTGEMIAALSKQTILKDAVDLNTSEINNEYLLKGYDYCLQEGLNKTLFKTRIQKNIFNRNKDETYSFFIGAVLCREIEHIIKAETETVVIGGKAQIKNAMARILENRANKKIIVLDEKTVDMSTVIGAIKIFEKE